MTPRFLFRTPRAHRVREVHGEHYFFVNHDEFRTMIGRDAFLEHAEVFGNYYGTSRETIEQVLASGVDVFLDIDWQGAQQIREKCRMRAVSLFCRHRR
jgi:guanylate kinase